MVTGSVRSQRGLFDEGLGCCRRDAVSRAACEDITRQGNGGGAAGSALALNGSTVTWLGGNNATQVRGPAN